jgi:hypothetical protein
MTVSFIGGGNLSTRKPPTYHTSLTNFITQCCIEYTSSERDSNSQLQWWKALIEMAVVNPNTIRSRPRRPLNLIKNHNPNPQICFTRSFVHLLVHKWNPAFIAGDMDIARWNKLNLTIENKNNSGLFSFIFTISTVFCNKSNTTGATAYPSELRST